RAVEGELAVHALPHGGKRQRAVLQFYVLEFLVLLVRPAHRAGELVPVLLDRQFERPHLVADLVLALPRPDWVYVVALRARKAAEPEYQRCRKNRLHGRLQEMVGGKLSDADRPPLADSKSTDAVNTC